MNRSPVAWCSVLLHSLCSAELQNQIGLETQITRGQTALWPQTAWPKNFYRLLCQWNGKRGSLHPVPRAVRSRNIQHRGILCRLDTKKLILRKKRKKEKGAFHLQTKHSICWFHFFFSSFFFRWVGKPPHGALLGTSIESKQPPQTALMTTTHTVERTEGAAEPSNCLGQLHLPCTHSIRSNSHPKGSSVC